MGSGTVNQGKISYEAISNDIRQLYARNTAFQQKRTNIASSYKLLGTFLADSRFVRQYPTLEQEINQVIGNWNPSNSIDQLKSLLNSYFTKISFIDKEISIIEGYQQKLLQLPDRHNRKTATDKIDNFLKNVSMKLSVAQLDRVKDDTIPKIHQLIKDVKHGFGIENDNVEDNKAIANSLLNRIGTYRNYVDKFGLRETCIKAEKIANDVLNKPDYATPGSDSHKLQQANKWLDQCKQLFDEEDKVFKQMMDNLDSTSYLMWKKDYTHIREELEKGSTRCELSANELESNRSTANQLKDRELSNLLNSYNSIVKDSFLDDIQYVRDNCVERCKLDELWDKFKRKKKELQFKVAKIVGIIVAIIIFIVIMVIYWPWSGITAGIILALLILIILKSR